ncbi:hypothetical protein STCU_01980 [Strigomonas culicis]|uniref:Transmembrane protein n=1 Tax=Strigomonas culicis TaxID=28005 RepID=S9W364_9TRYP|nr:hypothetical protein STCU_01980 [Strigomonas culicis]|eukprot:EPY33786.1 hypothetical protein STCU_01980 [Strigomonas culicis]
MELPEGNITSSPAPKIQAPKVKVEYSDVVHAARCGALWDFARERRYWLRRREIRDKGLDVRVIPVAAEDDQQLVRATTSRLLKEHDSASWGVFFYQAGIFGLTGLCMVSTAGGLYYGCTRNRVLLPLVPVGAAMTWRMWTVLEEAWAQQRYIDSAARLRQQRRANPMLGVVKRKLKDEAAEQPPPPEAGAEEAVAAS